MVDYTMIERKVFFFINQSQMANKIVIYGSWRATVYFTGWKFIFWSITYCTKSLSRSAKKVSCLKVYLHEDIHDD